MSPKKSAPDSVWSNTSVRRVTRPRSISVNVASGIRTVVMMACSGVALPARNAILPMIVKTENLIVANALGGGTWSIMLAFGATFGGIATAFLGVSAAMGIDAITFLASTLFFLRLPSLLPTAAKDKRGTRLIDGIRYLRSNPYILALTSIKPMMGFLGGMIVLIPFFGTTVFPNASDFSNSRLQGPNR